MAARALVTITNITQNAENSKLIDVTVYGCVVGSQGTLRKGKFNMIISSANPDATGVNIKFGIDNKVREFLTDKDIKFDVSDTVRIFGDIT